MKLWRTFRRNQHVFHIVGDEVVIPAPERLYYPADGSRQCATLDWATIDRRILHSHPTITKIDQGRETVSGMGKM